jgi:hypothetical protein
MNTNNKIINPNEFNEELWLIVAKTLIDFPSLDDLQRKAIKIATFLYQNDNLANPTDFTKDIDYDIKIITIINEILELSLNNEIPDEPWKCILRYCVQIVSYSDRIMNKMKYISKLNALVPVVDNYDDKILTLEQLGFLYSHNKITIEETAKYFISEIKNDLKLPEWFESYNLDRIYDNTIDFLLKYTKKFWYELKIEKEFCKTLHIF